MKTIILGLGKTGLSCATYLARQGEEFIICDTREQPPNREQAQALFPDSRLELGRFDPALLTAADRIIVSPGFSIHHPLLAQAKEKHIPLISDIELFAQHISAPVVAITGSNGKSTVTALVAAMAQTAGINAVAAGNIGLPVCDLLMQAEAELYVLELSSFQLATTYSLKPLVATILNITSDHLDWHTDFQDYVAAKSRIYTHAKNKIYNRDDPLTAVKAPLFTFGISAPANESEYGIEQGYLMRGSHQLFASSDLKLMGVHNQLNALAALALGEAIKLPLTAMQKTLREFSGLPHRCEWVAEYQGVQWYNDSKATNVGASISAITGLAPMVKGKIVLIAGGDAKGADLQPLADIAALYVSTAIILGKDAPALQAVLEKVCTVIRVETLAQAVQQAAAVAKENDIVLLAPACSSLDMFTDYQQRGRQFKDEVVKLCQK